MQQREYESIDGLDFLDLNEWNFEELLASSNNSVYSYSNLQNPNHRIAVKEINYKEENEEELFNKLKIIQKIKQYQHENIIKIYGVAKVKKMKMFGFDYSVVIGMEQAEGNLEDYIRMKIKQNDVFNFDEIQAFLRDILGAMQFLQKKMIAHRDIKPENILIKDHKFVLGDLDDLKLRGNKTEDKSIVFGTFAFSAPELLKALKKNYALLAYNAYKSDLYSFGLCLLYICNLKKFTVQERMDDPRDIMEGKIKQYCKNIKQKYTQITNNPNSGKILSQTIKACLESDPFKRMDIQQIYKKLVEKGMIEDDISKISPSFLKERCNTNDNSYYYYSQDQSQYSQTPSQFDMTQTESENYSESNGSSIRNTLSLSQIFRQEKRGSNKIQKSNVSNQNGNYPINMNQRIMIQQQAQQSNNNNQKSKNKKKRKKKPSLDPQKTFDMNNESVYTEKTKNQYDSDSQTEFSSSSESEEENKNFEIIQKNIPSSYRSNNLNHSAINSNNNTNQSNYKVNQKIPSQSALRSQLRYKQTVEELRNQPKITHQSTSSSNNNNLNSSSQSQIKPVFSSKQKIIIGIFVVIVITLLILGTVWIFKSNNCKAPTFKINNRCVESCPSKYFGNEENRKCESCISHCLKCKNKDSCEECESQYEYFQGVCKEIEIQQQQELEYLSEITT